MKSHYEGFNFIMFPEVKFREVRGLAKMTFTGFGNGNALLRKPKMELWKLPRLANKVSLSERSHEQIYLNQ